jgi:hypothetical protein
VTRRRTRPPPRLPWGEIHPTLDLHGHTANEAVRTCERWLGQQARTGVRTVRVITGRGRHSPGPPVLRGEIDALLSALRRTIVRRYELETGGGGFRVELRAEAVTMPSKPAPARRPPPRERPAGDPLRRRAEEALEELGITATPELIEAEIRRILRSERDRRGGP